MTRVSRGLQSGLPDDVDFALNHLVRYSYEAGDNLRWNNIPGLIESLVDQLSKLSPLLASFPLIDMEQMLEFPGNRVKMCRILDAALVLRNMSIYTSNAKYMATLPDLRSALVTGLTIPPKGLMIELNFYCLDIVEALSTWLKLGENLKLCDILVQGLGSEDRTVLIASLRGITRLIYRDESNRVKDIEEKLICRIIDLLLLDDEELLLAVLDFLYQYTAVDDNIAVLMRLRDALGILKHLKRLLLHGAMSFVREYGHDYQFPQSHNQEEPPATEIPHLPPDIVNELLGFPEPERAAKW